MPLYINTNVASLNSQRNLLHSTGELGTTFARLSSGLRINSARDDAAGLSISNRMTGQVRGLTQAIRNANDGISLAQVAEGALEETTNALQRMRELAVQSANDTNTTSDRIDLQKEVTQLVAEIDRIAKQTEFNTMTLLDGNFTPAKFQIGANSGQSITVSLPAGDAATMLGATTYQTATATGTDLAGNTYSAGDIVTAGTQPSVLLVSAGGSIATASGTSSDGISYVAGDVLDASGNFLATAGSLTTGGSVDISTQTDASATLHQIDRALTTVSATRSTLGAIQNRFESVVSNLSNVVENVSAARSRVMDADIAAETAKLTKNAILQQAGVAVLAQANQQPQLALQLLG